MAPAEPSSADLLISATRGFDYFFSNDLAHAKEHFNGKEDPYHLLGLGACAFIEAALGMETGLLAEATRCLSLSEAGARRQLKNSVKPNTKQKFPPGLEYEILAADAVVLLGLTNALRLYKTVFPNGLDAYNTPSATPTISRKPSTLSIQSAISGSSSTYSASPITPNIPVGNPPPAPAPAPAPAAPVAKASASGFFSRFTSSSSTLSVPATSHHNGADADASVPDGPVEDLIVAGTAFGFGLFNLVFSLLPKKVQGLVGFFGFKHDRKLALRALAVSAGKKDVHSVFSGRVVHSSTFFLSLHLTPIVLRLVLMTYYGVVLLLSGYQADEAHIIKQYKAIVDSIEVRYPEGALWILNRAKIMRMSQDPEGAIKVLRDGLRPERPHSFAQADTLLVFELAWTLLGQMRYQEAADMFIKVTELNTWSHGTYYFLAAGCYISIGNTTKAQALLDVIPELIDKKKMGGKDLPTEVLIKKKFAFYQEKQKRRGGDPKKWAEAVKISLAEELGLFWNTHARIDRRLALSHIREWSALTPVRPLSVPDPTPAPPPLALPLASAPASLRTGRAPRPLYGFSHDLQPMPPARHSASLDGVDTKDKEEEEGNPNKLPDLDTPDELAVRHLLVGICERTAGVYAAARASLKEACALQSSVKVSTWVGGVAMFELAVLDLKEVESAELHDVLGGGAKEDLPDRLGEWDRATKSAVKKLDAAMALAGNAVDLSSRLDSRVSMLRDEIAAKREALGI
ncbi:hypothetical protein H0H92_016051 [Tricholoma furcatifolium]|nr:hypothetical protein H0H92_016051 [Tricholoma furcatifolium]